MDCNKEFFLYISLRSWRPSVDSSETSVRPPFWILAEERLKKGEGSGERLCKGKTTFKEVMGF